MAWAVRRISENRLDGRCEYFMGASNVTKPAELAGCSHLLFATRAAARAYIKARWGYLAQRPDLRAEPHGWKMPQAVQVAVQLNEVPGRRRGPGGWGA